MSLSQILSVWYMAWKLEGLLEAKSTQKTPVQFFVLDSQYLMAYVIIVNSPSSFYTMTWTYFQIRVAGLPMVYSAKILRRQHQSWWPLRRLLSSTSQPQGILLASRRSMAQWCLIAGRTQPWEFPYDHRSTSSQPMVNWWFGLVDLGF